MVNTITSIDLYLTLIIFRKVISVTFSIINLKFSVKVLTRSRKENETTNLHFYQVISIHGKGLGLAVK